MQEAGRVLRDGGFVCLYGAFMVDGDFTTPSNRDFDQSLRERCVRARARLQRAATLNL